MRWQFSKDNLFIAMLSLLHTLFDPSGLDLKNCSSSSPLLHNIYKDWKTIEKPISRIRNNLGFHSAREIKGTKNGTSAVEELGKCGIETAMSLLFKLKQFAREEQKNFANKRFRGVNQEEDDK